MFTHRSKCDHLREVIASLEDASQELDWYREHRGFHLSVAYVFAKMAMFQKIGRGWKVKAVWAPH